MDIRKLFQATNPDRALFLEDTEEDRKYDSEYYIDFSSVRGGQVIEELKKIITFFSPDEPTCQLFTGHIGCGKSTELLKLKTELERDGFHVVYFESHEELEMSDVDVSDVLLAIAHHVDKNLAQFELNQPQKLKSLLVGIAKLLETQFDISAETEFAGMGITANTEGEFSLSLGIAKIIAKAKSSPDIRHKLRDYVEPRTESLIEAINTELLKPSIEQIKNIDKKGLVVIVDGLEKIDNLPKSWNRPQQEYLFIDRGLQLRSLDCHVVYTMPLSLRFCNEYSSLTQRFKIPKVLPMVRVKSRNGDDCNEGLEKLRRMVLARAFPELKGEERLHKITEIFDCPETLDYLCHISGGHVRNLLRLLNNSILKEMKLPITRQSLEDTIVEYRSERILAIEPHEWDLLRQVAETNKVTGGDGYETLIRSMFVYEYRDNVGSWFDINPILSESEELKK